MSVEGYFAVFGGWKWRQYTGASHQNHLHVSVVHDVAINSDVSPWGLAKQLPPIKPVAPPKPPQTLTKEQSMFFAKKSNSNTVWLITPSGKVGMNSQQELVENQKAVAAAGFNAAVVVFPIAPGIDAGNFIDKIPTIG